MNNLPKIALGAWAWGNDGTFGDDFTAEELKPIFDAAMASGLNLWDTAYAYGMGTSERILPDLRQVHAPVRQWKDWIHNVWNTPTGRRRWPTAWASTRSVSGKRR